jgi:hypothetical protein
MLGMTDRIKEPQWFWRLGFFKSSFRAWAGYERDAMAYKYDGRAHYTPLRSSDTVNTEIRRSLVIESKTCSAIFECVCSPILNYR